MRQVKEVERDLGLVQTEPVEYEIEVTIQYTEVGLPFIMARVMGSGLSTPYMMPNATKIEKVTFKTRDPRSK